MSETVISLRDIDEERVLLGHLDRNLRLLRSVFDVQVTSRGGKLTLVGDPENVESAADSVGRALEAIRTQTATADEVAEILGESAEEPVGPGLGSDDEGPGGPFRSLAQPRSANQKRYMEAILDHDVTFGVGPAGTGKTYLAVAMALGLVKKGAFREDRARAPGGGGG